MSGRGLVVASLFPARLNIHGDAENADVLRVRALWRGLEAELVTVATPADAEGLQPDAITIGAGFDSDAPEVLEQLRAIRDPLMQWVDGGAALLAVGLGWDLLSRSVELHAGSLICGIGIFDGHAVFAERRVGRIVTDSAWGPLTGYEYHLREYVLGASETPLGTVLSGVGNVAAGGPEGAVAGTAYGTGIRGPVLARNPALADHLLEIAATHAGLEMPTGQPDKQMLIADDHAHKANVIVRQALGLVV